MSSIMQLALSFFALTLIVPLMVWAQSTSWRMAWEAWKAFAMWIGVLLVIGLLASGAAYLMG